MRAGSLSLSFPLSCLMPFPSFKQLFNIVRNYIKQSFNFQAGAKKPGEPGFQGGSGKA
jgi:hypothetical protein